MDSDVYDVHAVAGILKQFFRDLNEAVLGGTLRTSFFQASSLESRAERLEELKKLIPQLPKENFVTLQMLCGHLIRIIQYSAENKMTLRNISIVFSPTLGIPAGLFGLILAEYPTLFAAANYPAEISSVLGNSGNLHGGKDPSPLIPSPM